MGTNRSKVLAVVLTVGLFVGCAQAQTFRVNARENPLEVSAFTLDFGEAMGGIASGMIALTDYTLEVDSTNGTARFNNYYQEIEPINLPGGNRISFTTDVAYGSKPPPTILGINPGESIDILFAGTPLAAFLETPFSRIGLHVQQIGELENSASFISVPEPSIGALGGLGILLLIRRRR